jgi:hypothetical protein
MEQGYAKIKAQDESPKELELVKLCVKGLTQLKI